MAHDCVWHTFEANKEYDITCAQEWGGDRQIICTSDPEGTSGYKFKYHGQEYNLNPYNWGNSGNCVSTKNRLVAPSIDMKCQNCN